MSILVYKQRFYAPNKPKTHENNYYYIRYIATRDGVELNEKSNHGLWGKVDGNKLIEFESWEEIASKVRYLSSKGVNIYRGILSFSSETAKEMGLESNKDWQDYIKSKIYIMARENGIDALNLEYCVAHHDKENQHVHIAFWDKEQKISKNFINPDLVDNLRKKLIKSTFKHELEKYYEAKNISKKEIKETTKEHLEEFSELLKAYHKKKNPNFEFQRKGVENASFPMQEEIRTRYIGLLELLPKQGSIDYKYLGEDAKHQVDELVSLFITHYEPLKNSYERYLKSNFDISSLYAKEEKLDDMLKTGEQEIRKYIANTILSSYREFLKEKKVLENKDRYDSIYMSREKKEEFAMNHLTDKTIQNIGFSLSTLFDGLSAERNNQNVHNFISKELSIFARRELRAKNKDRDEHHYQVPDFER